MALSAVDLYERLKPHLGEGETKALIEYVDGKIRGEVATKEDMLRPKADLEAKTQKDREALLEKVHEVGEKLHRVQVSLEEKIHEVRQNLATTRMTFTEAMLKDEIRKLRVLLTVLLAVVIVLSPIVLELVGRALGGTK